MPYIKQENRNCYNETIEKLANQIKEIGNDKNAGELNFIITKLLMLVYGPSYSYAKHNEIIGMLECCKQEWYRRQAAPYEDLKIKENGDV